MGLDRDSPCATEDRPALFGATIFDNDGFVVQGDGGADVPRDAVQHCAHREISSPIGFQYEMLLVVGRYCGLWELGEHHTRVWHFAGYGFVAEVQAKAVPAGMANDPGQKGGGWEKSEIREFCAVSGIPQHRGARTTFHIRSLGVNGKRRRASDDYTRHRETGCEKRVAQGPDGFKREVTGAGAFEQIALVEVSVVGVESAELEPVGGVDLAYQCRGGVTGKDAGSGLTDVQIDEQCESELGTGGGESEFRHDGGCITKGRETGLWKRLDQAEQTRNRGAHRLRSQEDIRDSGGGGYFGLGDGGHFALRNTESKLERKDLWEFVGFNVRTQTARVAGHSHHPAQVFLNALYVQYERRRRYVGLVFKWHPVGGFHASDEFENSLDFDGDVPWEWSHAHGAAGSDPVFLAEDFGE